MARISEFEQSGSDNLEVAISAAEYASLASGFQLRLTAFDQTGNEAPDTVNGGTLSFLLPTNQSAWTLDSSSGEYVYVQPIIGGSFTDNNHNVTYQGIVLSSVNATGYDTVEQAYMIGGYGETYDTSFASAINSSSIVPPGTAFMAIDQSVIAPGDGDATLRWDAPDIDTPVVTRGSDLGDSGGTPPPPCFVTGTLIASEAGERPVETLKVGDRVLTQKHGLQTIRWIGRQHYSSMDIAADEKKRPIRIGAGALGRGLPTQDLLVSRQHRMVVASEIVAELAGVRQVLIAAHRMVRLKHISKVCPAKGVTYHHLLFDRHEVVFANGAAAESFYMSKSSESAKHLSSKDMMDIEELGLLSDLVPSALPIPENKLQKEIVRRHMAEGLQVQAPPSTCDRELKDSA